MRSPRKIVRRLFCLTLALVSTTGWNTLPISSSGGAVRAATGVRAAGPADQAQAVVPDWDATGGLNTPRRTHTATLLQNGEVLVAGGGGSTNCGGSISSAELYDPFIGTWSYTGSLNAPRVNHTATLLQNGKVLVIGGNSGVLASSELYDPATGAWLPTGTVNNIRADNSGSAALLPNGKVLAVGTAANGTEVSAELYDPETETWVSTGAPGFVPSAEHMVLIPNGKVLAVYEGSPFDYGDLMAELYDPDTGRWSVTGSIINLFWSPTVTLMRNGSVLVTGLYGANHPTQARLYDADTGTWSDTGTLSTFRHNGGYTATLLADGQVLLAGGTDYPSLQPVSAEELYDPITGTWRRIGRLITGRYSHTATLLQNGRVLVTGGTSGNLASCSEAILGSSELYGPGTS